MGRIFIENLYESKVSDLIEILAECDCELRIRKSPGDSAGRYYSIDILDSDELKNKAETEAAADEENKDKF